MASLNRVFLMGRLTRDPEMRYLQSGNAVLNAGLAVNRKFRNRNNEMIEETTFVDIEGWGPRAEAFGKYLSKGRPVFIEGRLKLDSWEGKDGQKRNKLLVVMESFEFIDGGQGRSAGPDSRSGPPTARAGRVADRGGEKGGEAEDYDFDDIPF